MLSDLSTNGFGYRADDHGGTISTASAVITSGTAVSAAGVVEQVSDADWFSFTTGAGSVSFAVNVAQYGAMLDAKVELRNSAGNVIVTADSASLGEAITANVAAGTYYLVVASHGSYGDVGQYTVSGTIVSGTTPAAPVANAGGPYSVGEGGTLTLSGAGSTGSGLSYAWDLDGDGVYGESGAGAARGAETGVSPVFSAAGLDGSGSWTVGLRVTDSAGQTSTATAAVTITNAAPTLVLTGAASANEGSVYTLGLSANDPGPETISRWVINWGDGTAPQTVTGNPSSVAHTYADNGTYTITAAATDEDGTYNAPARTVTVLDVAPLIAVSGAAAVTEGATYGLTLGTAADPGTDTVTQYVVNWGDGTSNTYTAAGLKTHVYADGTAARTIAVTLVNEDGTFASAGTLNLTVNNVTPTLTTSGAASVNEGSVYTLGLGASDPGQDTIIRWVINWGDGTAPQTVNGNPSSVTHVYADNGSFTVSATATDEDGTYAAAARAVSVLNVAPTVTLSGASTVNEGSAYSLTIGAVTDPGFDAVTQYLVNWGDGTSNTYTTAGPKTHTYADGTAARTISVTLVDEDGTFANAGTLGLTVNNVAPALTLSGASAVSRGSVYTLGLASSDPGQDAITGWSINWGDGTAVQTVTGNPSSVTHTYAAAGSVTITATATDGDGTYGAAAKALSVAAVVPTVALGGAASVNEGAAYTLTLGAVSNATGTVTQYVVNWGDGTSDAYTTAGPKTHTYADGTAARTIAVGLTDASGTYNSVSTLGVTVNNVAPAVATSGAASVNEGLAYTLGLSAPDPGADTIGRWVINWGDGTALQTVTGNPSSVTHVYADNGTYAISASATDEDGTYAAAGRSVTVLNVAPRATVSGAASANEGAAYALTIGPATDPGADTVRQFVVNWGDGTTEAFTTPGVKTHVFADGPAARNVSVSLVDEDGTFAAGGVSVSVSDAAPVVTINGASSVSLGSTYTLFLSVADPGADAVSSWQVNWGDGTIETVTGNPSSVTHRYSASDTFTVSATATNEDGAFASNALSVTVPFMTMPAPAIALGGAAAVDEGSAYTVNLGALTEIAESAVTQYVVRWGDGTSSTYTTRGPKTHTYANGLSTPTITVDLVTATRTYTAAGNWSLTVRDVAPTLSVSGPATAQAGAAYTLSLAGSDPGAADAISTWVVDWGDGTVQEFGGDATTVSHTYATAGGYTVAAAATDDSGTYAAGPTAVTVVAVVTPPPPPPPADVTAPTASLNAAAVTAATASPYTFTVTYSDDRAINQATLDDSDLVVTGPNGFSQLARLASVSGDGATRVATYSLDAPGGAWDYADSGSYSVSVRGGEVKDAAGNAAGAGAIGSFAVQVPAPEPQPDLKGKFGGKPPKKTLAGAKGAAALQIENAGPVAVTGVVETELYVSSDTDLDGRDHLVARLTRKLSLRPGRYTKLSFKFAYPKGLAAGTYYLLARVDASGAIAEQHEGNNVVAWSNAPVPLVRPVAELSWRAAPAGRALVVGDTVVAGGRMRLPLELTNDGGAAATGTLGVTLVASPDATFDPGDLALGTIAQQSVKLRLAPGRTKLYALRATVPAGIAPGPYHLFAVIDGGNTTAEVSGESVASLGQLVLKAA